MEKELWRILKQKNKIKNKDLSEVAKIEEYKNIKLIV